MTTPQATDFYPGQPDYIEKLNLLVDRVSSLSTLNPPASGVLTLDLSESYARTFKRTLTQNVTLNITGGDATMDGKQFVLRVKQDATGNRTLALGTGINVGTDITVVTLSTAANLTDYIAFIYRHETGKADLVSIVKGFPNS